MSDFAIRAEKLSKSYKIRHATGAGYTYKTLQESLLALPKRIFGKRETAETFWALKDVSFDIAQGDRVGIIGRNGAGKSTLLKLLSKITEPTKGQAIIKGRVASLLEVGTGFHPELTGRENIFMNGAILGMTRAEIKSKFDEIVAFAEVEKFVDTPVKRYSSGMYVRLAFAVAAHLEPEILLVDEVLAVGDAQFQKKCLGKMGEVSNDEGRTVLFVSHNMAAIRSLCKKAIILEKGCKIFEGETEKAVNTYLQNMEIALERRWDDPKTAPGNEIIRMKSARVVCKAQDATIARVDTPIDIEFRFWNYEKDILLHLSMSVSSADGPVIFADGSKPQRLPVGEIVSTCHVPPKFFNDNRYNILLMFVKDGSYGVFVIHDVLSFEVVDAERQGGWTGKWPGMVRPRFEWDTKVNI